MSDNLIELDGSYGEGGGQIVRTSLALSLLTNNGFRLHHVRAGRKKPGLQPQHLMCVRAAAQIGNATVRGDRKGSTEFTFEPGEISPGKYRFDIGTAGATSLVLHTLYLPLCLGTTGPSDITLTGGTHVNMSPCYHFLDTTWRAYMAQLGLSLRLEINRPGFYPRGGGEVRCLLQPVDQLHGIHLNQRSDITATGFSATASLPNHVAKRQARRAMTRLEDLGIEAEIEEVTWQGGPGSVLGIALSTQPTPTFFFGLGARGKPAEAVADEAVDQVARYVAQDAIVDWHSADQIVLPMALASGPSRFRVTTVTQHLLTNIAVISHFLDRKIDLEGNEGEPGLVTIE